MFSIMRPTTSMAMAGDWVAASIGMAAYTTGATPGPRHPVKGADSEAAWLPLASLPTKRSSWAMSSMASAAAPTG